MPKAVLIMDMPEDCPTCKFFDSDGNCHATNPDDPWATDTEKAKSDWCPLRELPKHRRTVGKERENDQLMMNAGFNACLDEIMRHSVSDSVD